MRPVLVALSVAAFALVACQPSQSGAEAASTFCGDLRALNRSVAALGVTTGAATVGEFQQRMMAVESTWADLKESAKAVPQARTNDLEAAVNDLKQTVGSIPNDQTIVQAAQTVQPKVLAVGRAREQVGSGVRCPTAT
jgi:hypothetical protein